MKILFSIFVSILFTISHLQAGFTNIGMNVLSKEEAFKPSVKVDDKNILIDIKLGDKIYIYQDKIKADIINPKQISLTPYINFPKPENYHEFKIYSKEFKASIPLSIVRQKIGEQTKKIKLKLSFQGCSKLGLCYSPIEKVFDIALPNNIHKSSESSSKQNTLSKESSIVQTLANSSVLVVLITFFGFGLLLSLTPCIFPMIPILSSIIVSQSKENMSAKRGFFLSLVYVLSMSVAYTIAGVFAGLFGANIQIYMQNPWVIVSFSLIFVALAFSMFGYYELQLPSSFQAKVSKTSDKAQGKGLVSVIVMGFLSALIVGPCVAAPLAGALIYIGQTGDALLGGAALFVMSLGMGMPLLLIGLGAGKFMPKPGGWMENVSKVFGVVMLGVAVYMLSRIIPSWATMLLWAFLLIGSAVYLGALEPLKENISGIKKLPKVIGLIFLIYGIMLFVGAVLGNTNPLNPLENLTKSSSPTEVSTEQTKKSDFKIVRNIKEIEDAVKSSNRPVLLDFSANWCVSCKELEHNTFSDERVKRLLQKFTLLRADVTKNSKDDKEMMKKFNVFGPPVIIFFDKNHNELKEKKIVGYMEPEKFINHIEDILR